MQEKKALSSRGRGRLRGFLELRRPWGFSPEARRGSQGLSAAERSHPTSEVRGRSWEDPMPKGLRPRGVTPHPRSGAVAESTRLRRCRNGLEELPPVRGQGQRREELPLVQGQGRQPGGATPRLRPGAVAGRTNPTSKEPWLRGCRRA